MFLVLSASTDTYITNKVIDNKFRATDANVGRAGTIDIFKLYDESALPGTSSNLTELSRGLIKFDMSPLRTAVSNGAVDMNASSFGASLKMFNLLGGNTTPDDFKLVLMPLSQAFDEGRGRDLSSFNDLDAANFVTASYVAGSDVTWFVSGANAVGELGSADIDVIGSGNLGDGQGFRSLAMEQRFVLGTEDLSVDATTAVSATVANLLPDHGFRLSFTGSQETDDRSRFVKRFASRHSSNPVKRPHILVWFDDSIIDNHDSMLFDVTGTLFLNNYVRGRFANIVSGSGLAPVTGQDSLLLKLQTGSFSHVVTASQHFIGDTEVVGVYSATLAIPSVESGIVSGTTTLADHINASGSITFDEYWVSLDSTVGYLTSSITFKPVSRSAYDSLPQDLEINVVNSRSKYERGEVHRFKLFVRDFRQQLFAVKTPVRLQSITLQTVHYRIVDLVTGEVLVPFIDGGTRCSVDTEGLYFDVDFTGLPIGRQLGFEFRVSDYGTTRVLPAKNTSFQVV